MEFLLILKKYSDKNDKNFEIISMKIITILGNCDENRKNYINNQSS